MTTLLAIHWNYFWYPETGQGYAFWSGFGSCFISAATFGLVYHRLNCHVDGCKRVGIHPVPGTHYITCRRHHPTTPDTITASHIADAHKDANA